MRPTALEGDGDTKRSKSLFHQLGAADEVRNAAYNGVKPASRDSTCRSDAYAASDKLGGSSSCASGTGQILVVSRSACRSGFGDCDASLRLQFIRPPSLSGSSHCSAG